MNAIIICIIVSCCITYIWDFVNFPQELANSLAALFTKGKIKSVELKKPFSCSLCITTWTTLIILLILVPKLCWMCLLFGAATKYISYAYTLADKIISLVFILIERVLNKI